MTLDDVVTKTAVTIGTLIIFAALAWMLVPPALYLPGLILSGLVGFVAVLFVSFRRIVSPPLVLVYAAIEGVFIGLISNLYNARFDGIVVQAVIGTFVAAGVTLAAYKFFNIQVTPKFQKVVVLATIAFAALMLGNLVFSLFTGGGLGPPRRSDRHRHLGHRHRAGRAEPGARLRLHRAGHRRWAPRPASRGAAPSV